MDIFSFRRPSCRIVATGILVALFIVPQAAARAASMDAPGAKPQAGNRLDLGVDRNLIRDIQRRLGEIGLYTGALDGEETPALRSAIAAYEKQAALPVTGQPSAKLKDHLDDASEQAKRLLRRLEAARQKQVEEARGALAKDSRSVALMSRGTRSVRLSEMSEAERQRCGQDPDEMCLVAEALEALVQVTDSEQRDWVLGRLATFQALRGDQARALGVMLRISDPRLVVEGLRHVAWGMAIMGEMALARDTVLAIPLPRRQADALLSVAQVAAASGQFNLVADLVEEALSRASWMKKPLEVVDLHCNAARLLHATGNETRARALVDTALSLADDLGFTTLSNVGFHGISRTLLEMNDIPASLAVANRISPDSHLRDVAMADIVSRLRADGALDLALDHLAAIQDPARRAMALAELAGSLGAVGKVDGARDLLNQADRSLDTVKGGVTLDRVRMALAVAAQTAGDDGLASDYLEMLENKEIGARTAWALARVVNLAGRADLAEALRKRAEVIAQGLENPFDRAWLYVELALSAREDHMPDTVVRRLFDTAVIQARGNENPWFRARALVRVAIARLMIDSTPERFSALRTVSRD